MAEGPRDDWPGVVFCVLVLFVLAVCAVGPSFLFFLNGMCW